MSSIELPVGWNRTQDRDDAPPRLDAPLVLAPAQAHLIRAADTESPARQWGYLLVAIGIAALYLALILQYWAPAHGGVDQNGYFVGGRMIAKTGTMQYTPESPYGFVGAMWVRTDDGRNFPKYPIGLPLLFACCFWIFGDAQAPYVANLISPISAALALVGMFLMCRVVAGSFVGLLAMIVLGTSQATMMLANNPNSHAPALAFVCWGMFLLLSWWKHGGWWRGIVGGFLIGYAATIRYTEALLLVPIGLAVLFSMPWASGRDAILGAAARSAAALTGLLLAIAIGLILPGWQVWTHGRAVDLRILPLFGIAITIPWLTLLMIRSIREIGGRKFAMLIVPAVLLTLGAVAGPLVDQPWTLLLLPGIVAGAARLAGTSNTSEIDWPRLLAITLFAVVVATIALLGLIVPTAALIGAGIVYAIAALRWRDLRAASLEIPIHSIVRPILGAVALVPLIVVLWKIDSEAYYRNTLIWITALGAAAVIVGAYTVRRTDDGHWHSLLDAPRILIAAGIIALAAPVYSLFPGLLLKKEWLALPAAIAGITAIAAILATRTWLVVPSLRAWMPLVGWAIPIAFLLGYNVTEMGTLTGYDTTNESQGNAFTWANFIGNWEKVIRQINDIGLVLIAPIGLLGLVVLFRRSWQAGLIVLTWLVPGLIIYAAYYWSPERGTSYLRFFLTLLPALVLGAAVAMHRIIGSGTTGRHSIAGVIAAGVVVAGASGLGVYRSIEGFEFGTRSLTSLEGQHRQNLNLALVAEMSMRHVPAGSVLFTEGGFGSNQAHYLQFAGDWEIFTVDAFTTRGGQRLTRRSTVGENDPNPLQPAMREFMRELYANKTDSELQQEQDALIEQRLREGRRVFVLAADPGRGGPAGRIAGRRFEMTTVARVAEMPPIRADLDQLARGPGMGAPPMGGPPDRRRDRGNNTGAAEPRRIHLVELKLREPAATLSAR